MRCPETNQPVEICACRQRHYCGRCREISLNDADDRDLTYCRCGGDENPEAIAEIEDE